VWPLNSIVRCLKEAAVKWILPVLLASSLVAANAAEESPPKPIVHREPAAARALVAAAMSLKIGDSRQVVLEKLRTPSSDEMLTRKRRPEVVGRSMVYYVVQSTRDGVNEIHDQYVSVFLDPQDNVKSVSIRVVLTK
jgi:hypothetical protein